MAKVTRTKKTPAAKEAKTASVGSSVGFARQILVRPVVSEKTVSRESQGVYTFVVRSEATKVDVKLAVKEAYGVMPKKVTMLRTEGKVTRSSSGGFGRRSALKKAIVTLAKDARISIHEGV
jgi:large subunit ribosomal protein L23